MATKPKKVPRAVLAQTRRLARYQERAAGGPEAQLRAAYDYLRGIAAGLPGQTGDQLRTAAAAQLVAIADQAHNQAHNGRNHR